MRGLLLVMLVGCATSAPTAIQIESADSELIEHAATAVATWDLGFDVQRDGAWVIRVERVNDLRGDDGRLLGYASDHLVQINATLEGDQLQHVLIHEFGHLLLDTNCHLTERDQIGVMFYTAEREDPTMSWLLVPTDDDRALAGC